MIVWQEKDDGSLNLVDARSGNVVATYSSSSITPVMLVGTVARTDTSSKTLFTLPVGAVVTDVSLYSPLVSNAGTTAIVSVGTAGSAVLFANTVDVKTAAGKLSLSAKAGPGLFTTALTVATPVLGIYAETGTASTTGGPYSVTIWYHL